MTLAKSLLRKLKMSLRMKDKYKPLTYKKR